MRQEVKKPAPKKQPTKVAAKEVTLKTILTNAAIIVAVIIAIAIAAHFILRTATRHGVRRDVPQFTGMSLSEAELLAKNSGLKLFINDSLYVTAKAGGEVLDQLPDAGTRVKPGRTIYVVINAFGRRMVQVPYVAGRSLRQAKNMLDVAGLEIKQINYVSDMATNYVLRQSYNGKSIASSSKIEAPVGSGVDLTVGVSSNDPTTLVPNVVGLSLREAKSRIWESGLNVGAVKADKGVDINEDKNAKVYQQGARANTQSRWGGSVSLTLTNDLSKVNSAANSARKAELEYEQAKAEEETQKAAEAEEAEEQDDTTQFFQ
ncbi:MAG: PASTA domain-containing protein [Rikenellaceae bacterium]